MKKKLGLFILATTLLCIGCGGETPSQLTPTPDNFMPTMEEPREPSKNPSLDPSQPKGNRFGQKEFNREQNCFST